MNFIIELVEMFEEMSIEEIKQCMHEYIEKYGDKNGVIADICNGAIHKKMIASL